MALMQQAMGNALGMNGMNGSSSRQQNLFWKFENSNNEKWEFETAKQQNTNSSRDSGLSMASGSEGDFGVGGGAGMSCQQSLGKTLI